MAPVTLPPPKSAHTFCSCKAVIDIYKAAIFALFSNINVITADFLQHFVGL